jgi:putative endonuclease
MAPGARGRGARYKQRFGRRGEELAAAWYRQAGYELVARNWRCSEGELDLVLRRPGTVVFCEVKSRSSDRFGLPVEAVTPAKQRRLRVLAARFLREHPQRGATPRFDVASVMGDHIEVLEGAF